MITTFWSQNFETLPNRFTADPAEAEYQNLIRRGFKIIRNSYVPCGIEVKLRNKRGWKLVEKFTTAKARSQRVSEMLKNEKILLDI